MLDANDNTPTFSTGTYTAVVPENVPVGFQVTQVTAVDADVGDNAGITYSLQREGNIKGKERFNTCSQKMGENTNNG